MRFIVPVTVLAAGLAALGCGGGTPEKADPKSAAKAKVEAAQKMAEAIAKDPNGGDEGFIALESFRNTSMNPKDHPQESKEIIDIYEKRIKGKTKGETGEQIRLEFLAFKGLYEKS
jgi:hypothetical protein